MCVTGSLVAGAGLLLASYTASVTQLLVTYSLVTGLGFGLMYIPGVVAAQVTRPPPRPRPGLTADLAAAAGPLHAAPRPRHQASLAHQLPPAAARSTC